MTVNTGPPLYPGSGTFPGNTTFPGLGDKPLWQLLVSFDDVSRPVPTWTYISPYLRGFSSSRGRSSEIQDIDAGTLTLTLDNRDRRFDPNNASSPYSPNLRPMNRIWLRTVFNGATFDVFKGYVESYEQQYPEAGLDAVTLVKAVDEFKVIAQRNQPNTDPPRDTYADVVQFDNPVAYWTMSDDAASLSEHATIGPDLACTNAMNITADGAIAGDNPAPTAAAVRIVGTNHFQTVPLQAGEIAEFGGLSALAVEAWVKFESLTGGSTILQGPFGGVTTEWFLSGTTSVTPGIFFGVNNTVPTGFTVLGPVTVGQWMHVVGALGAGTLRLYINGAQVATTAFTGTVNNQAGQPMHMGIAAGNADVIQVDEVAIYRYELPAARVLAHYQAGAQRGFVRSQLAGERLGAVLDSISSQAPRNLRTGARPLAGQYDPGKPALDTARAAQQAEAVDAVMFIAKDGTVTFLDGGHRSVSPWNTVQATFGDAGGTELAYLEVQLDFSDAFLANEWNVTRSGGTTQTATDATSVSRYNKRPQSLTDLKLRDDSDALAVAAAMLAKYKEPFTRVLSITPRTTDAIVIDAVLRLEIGDRIRVLQTPIGGGARLDQTLFVQSIQLDMTALDPAPKMVFGVSPV